MKSVFFIFTCLGLTFSDCKYEKAYPLELFEGKTSETEKNHAVKRITGGDFGDWYGYSIAEEYTEVSNTFGLAINTRENYEGVNVNRESLGFQFVPKKEGKYILPSGFIATNELSGYYGRIILDGDVIGASYYPIEGYDSWIEVTELDTVTNLCKGRFNVGFKIDGDYSDSPYPPEVYFENGSFEVTIQR